MTVEPEHHSTERHTGQPARCHWHRRERPPVGRLAGRHRADGLRAAPEVADRPVRRRRPAHRQDDPPTADASDGSVSPAVVSPAVAALAHAANLLAQAADQAFARARRSRIASAVDDAQLAGSHGQAAAWMATGLGAQLAACQILDLVTPPAIRVPRGSAALTWFDGPDTDTDTDTDTGTGTTPCAQAAHAARRPGGRGTPSGTEPDPVAALRAAARALGVCPIEQCPPGTSDVVTLVATLLRTAPASPR